MLLTFFVVSHKALSQMIGALITIGRSRPQDPKLHQKLVQVAREVGDFLYLPISHQEFFLVVCWQVNPNANVTQTIPPIFYVFLIKLGHKMGPVS